MRVSFDLTNPTRPKSSIRMRLSVSGQRTSLPTGLNAPPQVWASSQRVKIGLSVLTKHDMTPAQAKAINERLDALQSQAMTMATAMLQESEGYVDLGEIKRKIVNATGSGHERKEHKHVVDAMNDYIDHMTNRKGRNGKATSQNTLKAYRRARNAIQSHESKHGKPVHTMEVNAEFHRKFIDTMEASGYKPSYASKIMDCAKAALRWAEGQGYPVHRDVLDGKLSKIQPERWRRATISTEELKHLMAMDLKGRHEKTRDLLVIGCWTALRVSDIMKLGNVKVYMDDEGEFIQVESTKVAGTYIEVPLHEHVQQIRQRWNGWPPAISDQRFNEYAKELCKMAGMTEPMRGEVAKMVKRNGKMTKRNVAGTYEKWELISSHTCRRSFATNFYGIIPTGDIMHVTGHSSERQLMDYIHAKPIDTRRRVRAAMASM